MINLSSTSKTKLLSKEPLRHGGTPTTAFKRKQHLYFLYPLESIALIFLAKVYNQWTTLEETETDIG